MITIIVGVIYGYWLFGELLDPVLSLEFAIILATPLLIDWGTQKVGIRESNNYLRVFTGFLFGIGFSLLQFTGEIFFWTVIVMTCYALIMLLLIEIRKRKERKKILN